MEKITVPFADRCKEYSDAGIPLKPTTIQTNRFKFGAFWVTAHLYLAEKFEKVGQQIFLS